ncbi:hypothetical protein GGX14DRAFT_701386 [Mycena pura]|uniref:Uncharacterized protein n=1 Tax=Mycena pura TaxID=153505 RepID=A0AAD6UXD9_9AGAR|nr:hypothetical protein GGX14DRAFT_701386 [Mycena pura]
MADRTTNPFCAIGIYRAPDHLSREELEANMKKLGNDVRPLPAAQNNLLKLNMIYQNDKLAKSIQGMGLPEAPATVLITAECNSAAHLSAYMLDPEVARLVAECEPFRFARGRLRVLRGRRNPDRQEVPGHIPVAEYHAKIDRMVESFISLPVAQQHLVKHTTWLQNNVIAREVKEWGFPEAEKTVLVMLECGSWESMDKGTKKIAAAAMDDFGLHVESNCFSADVDTLIHKNCFKRNALMRVSRHLHLPIATRPAARRYPPPPPARRPPAHHPTTLPPHCPPASLTRRLTRLPLAAARCRCPHIPPLTRHLSRP